jgi:hypothetical protein
MAKIRIKDTGLNKVGGTEIHPKVASGAWLDLDGFRLTYEFNVLNTNVEAYKDITYLGGKRLDYAKNAPTILVPPRITLQGIIKTADHASGNMSTLQNLLLMRSTFGVKRISGGYGVIDILPEVATDTHKYISVIITNITVTEQSRDSTDTVAVTVQLKQV